MFFESIRRKVEKARRYKRLARIRQEFLKCGYSLDHLNDSEVSAALGGGRRIEEVPLTAKSIYFALRRLSAANHLETFFRRKESGKRKSN